MNEQGCSRLEADADGWILDRLRGLEKVISQEMIDEALRASGKGSKHQCTLTSEVMMWVVLAMGLFTEMPIRQVFRHSRRLRENERTPARSSLCMARQRLGAQPLRIVSPSGSSVGDGVDAGRVLQRDAIGRH